MLLFSVSVRPVKAPVTIIVPDDYSTIQAAINAASDGDTIYVRNGTYYENVVLNKSVALVGENAQDTIINGTNGTAVTITTDSVNVTGFTITNCECGVSLLYSNSSIVSGNNITNSWEGIDLYSSFGNVLSGNIVTANDVYGIWLNSSSGNNTLSDNDVTANNCDGIELDSSSGNVLSGNNLTANYCGVDLSSSSGNRIFHDDFLNNTSQASVSNSTDTWDDGYPSGGNYWSDYHGTDLFSGPYQNLTGSDGIGDTPYVIDANNSDNYPLMDPYSAGLLSVTISPESVTLYISQSQLFSSVVSGGALPYSYQWYLNGTPVLAATLNEWNFNPARSGSYSVFLQITDGTGQVAQSGIATVAVARQLGVSISPVHAWILTGQSITLTSTVWGGYTPYSYQWYLNGTSVQGATLANWTFNATESGTYLVWLVLTDANMITTQSYTTSISVTIPESNVGSSGGSRESPLAD
jgi:parallel beta-helix repeat protein